MLQIPNSPKLLLLLLKAGSNSCQGNRCKNHFLFFPLASHGLHWYCLYSLGLGIHRASIWLLLPIVSQGTPPPCSKLGPQPLLFLNAVYLYPIYYGSIFIASVKRPHIKKRLSPLVAMLLQHCAEPNLKWVQNPVLPFSVLKQDCALTIYSRAYDVLVGMVMKASERGSETDHSRLHHLPFLDVMS